MTSLKAPFNPVVARLVVASVFAVGIENQTGDAAVAACTPGAACAIGAGARIGYTVL